MPEWLIPLGTLVVTLTGSIWSLAWWMSNQFDKVRINFQDIFEKHEKVDQYRHEQNLVRFERIGIQLAKLEAFNGFYNGRNYGTSEEDRNGRQRTETPSS